MRHLSHENLIYDAYHETGKLPAYHRGSGSYERESSLLLNRFDLYPIEIQQNFTAFDHYSTHDSVKKCGEINQPRNTTTGA